MQKRVTISLDEGIYRLYHDFCEDNCMIISKKIEKLIKKELMNEGLLANNGVNKK